MDWEANLDIGVDYKNDDCLPRLYTGPVRSSSKAKRRLFSAISLITGQQDESFNYIRAYLA
jgi:hypothetical protein